MIWVPEIAVNKKLVAENYVHSYYDDKMCSKCEYLEDRHCSICDGCEAFKERVVLYSKKKIGKHSYIGLPIGDKRNVQKDAGVAPIHLKEPKMIRDKRPSPKMCKRIRFTGTLNDYQEEPVKQFIKAGYGILKAPPRTGKTVMATYVICKMGLKTLVLTNQNDLCKQFIKAFDDFTDHKDKAFVAKKQLVGIAKNLKEILDLDVCLTTYQTFLSLLGKKKLKAIRRKFGVIIVDEIHRGAATEFRKVINALCARHKFGLTATVERKDGRHLSILKLVGPVTAKSKRKALKPKVFFHPISRAPKKNTCKTWNGGMSWIAGDVKRNRKIAEDAIKNVLKGHHVVIPVVRVGHCTQLVDLINKLWKKHKKDSMAKAIAQEFTGKTRDRAKVLHLAESGKMKVTVGIRSIIATGINVKRWSLLMEVIPISNEPNHYQEAMRIGTEMPGKPQPEIHHYVSGWGAEYGCLRTCMRVYNEHCIVDKKQRAIANDLINRRSSNRDEDAYDKDNKPFRAIMF